MKFVKETKNNIEYYTVPEFTEQGFINIFTTKIRGESFDTKELNFGTNCNDTEEAILNNYKSVLELMNSTPEMTVKSKQTHSDIVIKADKSYGGEGIIKEQRFTEADGLITTEKDLTLLVFFADCVPILIADKKTKAIAAVHSGWKGTKDNITARAIEKFINESGSNPDDLLFAIGPSIGICHFEVGEDVYDELTSLYGANCGKIEADKYYLDLKQAVVNQIMKFDIPIDNIAVSDECTYCSKNLYSFRREAEKAGRMSAFIKASLR